jgi:hypothetical protein
LSLLAGCALREGDAEGAAEVKPKVLLITHASVVNVLDGRVASDRAILIEGERITAIDADAAGPWRSTTSRTSATR